VSRTLFLKLKALATRFHDLLARSATLSRVYLGFWSLLLRVLPRGSTWNHFYSRLMAPAWPIERFAPRRSQLIGTDYALTLVPHPGMIDFQALFTRDFEYEPEVIGFLEGQLEHVDNVVEIGANVGIHTLYFSHCFARRGHGRIFTFEPSPRTFRALLDNLIANDATNVTPLNAAVFTRTGLATFYEPTVAAREDRALTRSSLIEQHARWDARQVREYPVFTVDPGFLEVLFKDQGRVLMKLDIEGAEKFVLTALQPLLEKYRPAIVMEVLHNDCDALNSLDFLPRIYQLFHLTDAGPVEHPRFMGDPTYRFKDYFLAPRWH